MRTFRRLRMRTRGRPRHRRARARRSTARPLIVVHGISASPIVVPRSNAWRNNVRLINGRGQILAQKIRWRLCRRGSNNSMQRFVSEYGTVQYDTPYNGYQARQLQRMAQINSNSMSRRGSSSRCRRRRGMPVCTPRCTIRSANPTCGFPMNRLAPSF